MKCIFGIPTCCCCWYIFSTATHQWGREKKRMDAKKKKEKRSFDEWRHWLILLCVFACGKIDNWLRVPCTWLSNLVDKKRWGAQKKTEHKRQRKSRNAKVLVSCGLSEWFFQLSWVFLTFTFKIHRPIQIIIASLKKKLWNVLNKAQPTSRFMQPEKHTHKLSFISNAKCAKFPRKFRSTWNTVVSVCSQLKIDRKRKENKTESVSKEIFS